jgi:hypothetical protein
MKTIRNIGHYIFWFMVAYIITNATGIYEYKGFYNLFMICIAGFMIGLVGNFFYEWFVDYLKINAMDMQDNFRSGIGGYFGTALAFFIDNKIIITTFTIVILIIIVAESWNILKKIKK